MPNIPQMPEMQPPLLNVQQFTAADVLAVSGLTAGQLKGILDRNQITLSTNHNPGTGRRRMFTGQDLIALCAVQAAGQIGFPLRWGNALAQQVMRFAMRQHFERAINAQRPHFALAFYPLADGEDYAFVPIHDGRAVSPLPTAYQVLDVSREIDQTLAKLRAIVEGDPLPDFTPEPPKEYENPFAPKSNFFKDWKEDAAGNWLLVGLTLEETREYMDLQGWRLVGDDLEYDDRPHLSGDDLERSVFLSNKHECAKADD
jgi:hypothetical protein